MVTERIDGADWPPGCESDAGYYGVRVGDSLGLVSGVAMTMAPRLPETALGRLDSVMQLYSEGAIDVWQTRELLGVPTPPSNPWTRYGLNAREYGWHLPRGRA